MNKYLITITNRRKTRSVTVIDKDLETAFSHAQNTYRYGKITEINLVGSTQEDRNIEINGEII